MFSDYLKNLRTIGRKAVLPIEKIEKLIKASLQNREITSVLDFGAGTGGRTKRFSDNFHCEVYAVDTYYQPKIEGTIHYYSSLEQCLSNKSYFNIIRTCDVLHHIPPEYHISILDKFTKSADIIIIKDIDQNHTFGNHMNHLHDRIINHENIYDIDPDEIQNYLKSHGFNSSYYYLPKLRYPHFMLIATKN